MGVEVKNVQDIKIANESSQVYEVKKKDDEKNNESIFLKIKDDDEKNNDNKIVKIDPEFDFIDSSELQYYQSKTKELDDGKTLVKTDNVTVNRQDNPFKTPLFSTTDNAESELIPLL